MKCDITGLQRYEPGIVPGNSVTRRFAVVRLGEGSFCADARVFVRT